MTAEHAPREMLIGRPTVQAVWGQKLLLALLDLYLGKKGLQPQMANAPNQPHWREPCSRRWRGDPGTHGPYRDRERRPDLQM